MAATDLTHVLVVEDDPDIRAIAHLALEILGGYTVTLCSSGMDALVAAHESPPNLVLLDVMMPDLDGPSTLRLLRNDQRCADTPVIFMTAKVQPADVAAYTALGAMGVIAKPFDPMTLAVTVQSLWEEHHEKR